MPNAARPAYRITLASVLLLGCAIAMAADKAAELSEEFLEYLASMESDDESWTEFATAAPTPPPVVAASSSSSSSRASAASSAATVNNRAEK